MFISFGTTESAISQQLRSQCPLSSSVLFYLVYRYDVFLCNEESKNSIEDWLNLTCFRTLTALHWKREVSKEPFQFILQRVIDDLSSTGVYQVLVYWQFLYKALENGPREELLFKNWCKNTE